MKIIGIIPARMASTRFPGKPLAKIKGIPMIGHVYFRSKQSKILDEVYIATCDSEIADYAASIGAEAIMTRDTHQRASDRASEAMLTVEANTGQRVDIVVMIQGDEPMINPEMIDEVTKTLIDDESIQVANLMALIKDRREHNDPNEVKVVVGRDNFALYFSREPIPSWKKSAKDVRMLKQVCVIPFRRDFLIKFGKLEPTPLEIVESIDMLRVLEHGLKVKMVMTNTEVYSVDTVKDLEHVESLIEDKNCVY